MEGPSRAPLQLPALCVVPPLLHPPCVPAPCPAILPPINHPQVYGIIALQLVLTAAVAAVVVLNASVQQFMLRSVWVQVVLLLASMLALIPIYIWRHSHPHNLVRRRSWQGGRGRQRRLRCRRFFQSSDRRAPLCSQVLLGVWTCLFSGEAQCGGRGGAARAMGRTSAATPCHPHRPPPPARRCPAVTVGMACSFYQPVIVMQALIITAAVVRARAQAWRAATSPLPRPGGS